MIRPAEKSDFSRINATDPFFTRILSLYESYGEGLDFVAFWVQENEGRITAAISRFEDKFSLWLTENSDLDEITAFIRFQGAGSCLYNAAYPLDFPDDLPCIGGQIMEYLSDDYISDIEIYEPDFKALYNLLKSCESPIFIVPEYLLFLSDVTHRKNREKLHLAATAIDGRNKKRGDSRRCRDPSRLSTQGIIPQSCQNACDPSQERGQTRVRPQCVGAKHTVLPTFRLYSYS